MKPVRVIILAQGCQRRLSGVTTPKQLIPLPACGGVPIMLRTLHMLRVIALQDPRCHECQPVVCVVTWPHVTDGVIGSSHWGRLDEELGVWFGALDAPGNSSLAGIRAYLGMPDVYKGADLGALPTIVLLGDVVYSWACLDALFRLATAGHGFVGTCDLGRSTGELWGVAWRAEAADGMKQRLERAALCLPPVTDVYQPGQLRRWMSGWAPGATVEAARQFWTDEGWYVSIDDYTMDVDLPRHIPLLEAASEHAARDDAAHGLTWE